MSKTKSQINSAASSSSETKVVETKVEKINSVLSLDLEKLKEEHKTKSSLIRYLLKEGHSRSNIAKALNIRYQHVRNVDVQVLKTKQD